MEWHLCGVARSCRMVLTPTVASAACGVPFLERSKQAYDQARVAAEAGAGHRKCMQGCLKQNL